MRTTRRSALVTIAAGAASTGCSSDPGPTSDRLAVLVDTIIPETDTPGAHQAGVTRMLGEDAAADPELARRVEEMVAAFAEVDFFDQDEEGRIAQMTSFMEADDERREHFQFLKNAVIDRYYTTEVGLVDELGYQGGTYLPEFPGCQEDHQLEEGPANA